MRRRHLILLGLAGFLAGLLLQAPAATVYGWLLPKESPPAYVAQGLQGSVSQGRFAALLMGGRPLLEDVSWNLRSLGLLIGRAAFRVEGGRTTLVSGGVSISALGTLRLSDFVATGSVKPLLAAAGQAYLPVDGQVRLDLRHLRLSKGLPQSVEGELQAQGLAWTLAREPLQLGDYRAELSTEDGEQRVKISSVSGPLELNGNGRFTEDQSYELELKFRPKPEASPMLRNLVASAGAPDLQGYYTVRQKGKLVK